jgi:hypothetical protein
MKPYLLLFRSLTDYILLLILLMFSSKVFTLEIENVKSGAFCKDHADIRRIYICNDAERAYVMNYRKCIANDKKVPCLSTGFEFDYKDMTAETKIKCKSTFIVSTVDPNEAQGLPVDLNLLTSHLEFELNIPLGGGHKIAPVSTAVYYLLEPAYSVGEETSCFNGENVVFEYQYKVIYPRESDR